MVQLEKLELIDVLSGSCLYSFKNSVNCNYKNIYCLCVWGMLVTEYTRAMFHSTSGVGYL